MSGDSVYHNHIRVRGPDSRPDQILSEDTVHHTYEAEDTTPDQKTSSIIAQIARAPPIIDFSDDQDAWDTIIICSLLGQLFGRGLSSVEIANAIIIRDQREGTPLGPESVEHMLEIAKLPSTQQQYPETCQYQKWKAAKDRLTACNGVRDSNDVEMSYAYIHYKDTLRLLNSAALGRRSDNLIRHDSKQNDHGAAGQQSESQHSLAEEYEP